MEKKSHTENVIRTLEVTKNPIESAFALLIFDYLHILPSGKLICIKNVLRGLFKAKCHCSFCTHITN